MTRGDTPRYRLAFALARDARYGWYHDTPSALPVNFACLLGAA